MFKNLTKYTVYQISFCNWFMSKFMILTLFSSNKQFNQLVFCDWGTCKSAEGVSWESITAQHLLGMDWIRLWITCTGMATHSCWSAWNNSSTFTGVFTLPQTRLSNSSQVYSTGSKLIWAHGRPGENLDIGVGEELCGISLLHGVWHCHVELQRHTTFEAKKYAFLFLNSILIYEQKNGTNAQTILLQNGKHICLHFSNSCMILNVTKTGINAVSYTHLTLPTRPLV